MKILVKLNNDTNNEYLDSYDRIVYVDKVNEEIPNAIVTHFEIGDVLDYTADRSQALSFFLSKLRSGGRIIITGSDLLEIVRNLFNRNINMEQAQSILFGGRLSMSYGLEMKDTLKKMGLKIITARFNGTSYYIMAERPKNEVQRSTT